MQEKGGRATHGPCDAIGPSMDPLVRTCSGRRRSPRRPWWRRANRSRRGPACGRSSGAATPSTPRLQRRRFSASPSRCRRASAAISSRRSGTVRSCTASTPQGRRRCARTRTARSRTPARASVTVPGAVAGWAALAERFGRLGLDRRSSDAATAAEEGFAVAVETARTPGSEPRPPSEFGPRAERRKTHAPAGARARACGASRTKGRTRSTGARSPTRSFRHMAGGRGSRRLPAALGGADLARLSGPTVCELPPPTQGVAALEGLGLLAGRALAGQPGRCVRLALEDAFAYVRDGADVTGAARAPDFLSRRRQEGPPTSASRLAAPSTSAPSTATVWPSR